MVGAVLAGDLRELEKVIIGNVDHVNDPIGLPFEPGARFADHPALSEMVILQHPGQTLFDVACGMPCGPIIWVLFAYGAKGSKHPVGMDLALHNAIKNGRAYTVQALLQPGRSDVNALPGSNWGPLRQAIFWNVPDVVQILLNRGAKIDDAGPPPRESGIHTALQLCLLTRLNKYTDPAARKRCHSIIEMLLSAGANIHCEPPEPVFSSTFDMFVKPWENYPHWACELSPEELDCFRLFISKGASISVNFKGYPCESPHKGTFEHQALWHSTPTFARWLIDSFVLTPANNGSSLLYEILDCCPKAKRHPADTLRDIQVLLEKGVDPNRAAGNSISPLRKCIANCPTADLVPRLRILLDGGADPEAEDADGVQPYIRAAETFKEPLLSEVMSALVSKIPGKQVRSVNGIPYTWAVGHFPVSKTQTYDQVMACTRQTGDFILNMRNMVPEHVQSTFQKAYFAVVSECFLNTMTWVTKSKMLSSKEKAEIVWVVSMRDRFDLPKYNFDQSLVIALLDPQTIPSMVLGSENDATTTDSMTPDPVSVVVSSPASSATITTTPTAHPVHTPFQFNPNNATSVKNPPPSSDSSQWLDDFFVASPTQIRWHDPCAPVKPGDSQKAAERVLAHECTTCNDGKLLTKGELERHETEHEHTAACDIIDCRRRFCVEKRSKRGYQMPLFGVCVGFPDTTLK
jgi:hypothetical protein